MIAATIGTRIPSCGLVTAAITVKIAARSGRSRHSSRMPSSRKTTPTESTWPQMTLSNQVIGLTTAIAPASSAARGPAPSSRVIDQASQPMATSARMAGSLMRSVAPLVSIVISESGKTPSGSAPKISTRKRWT